MMECTVENIEKAVHQFYYGTSEREVAHHWLTRLQSQPEAWTFCWKLLAIDKAPEVQFFGARSLHNKIARFWHEVPPEELEQLRGQLLQQILAYAHGPKMVLTRLCVGLASLVLQSSPEHWKNSIQDLVSSFQAAQAPAGLEVTHMCQILLEILTVLPEEFSTATIAQNRRAAVRGELQAGLKTVLGLLQSIFNQPSTEQVQQTAIRCFSNWVQFGIPPDEAQPLVLHVFQCLSNQTLFDNAIDALINVFSHHDIHRYTNTIMNLLPHIINLQQMYSRAVEEQDMVVCQGLTRLIVTTAEHNTQVILSAVVMDVKEKLLVQQLVNMVLQCSAVPGYYPVDETFSDMPFGFWYILQDEILGAEKAVFEMYHPVFVPLYMSLITVLQAKSQYPPNDQFETWAEDEKEQHRCYRQDIADTLMYCYNFLREPLLHHLCGLLTGLVEKSRTEEVRWQELEGILFCIGAVAESVDLEESHYIPTVFKLLPQMVFNHVRLVSQAVNLIGSYAEWINYHPEALPDVIPLMLQGLKYRDLGQSATLSLKAVCGESQEHLGPFVKEILTTSQEVLSGNTLKAKDVVRLMCCLGYVLSILPIDQIMEQLTGLLGPHLEQLQQLLQQQNTAAVKNTVLLKLNMLSMLFSTLNTRQDDENETAHSPVTKSHSPQPVALVLQQLLPTLQPLLSKWISDNDVVDAVCEMMKRALRTMLDDFLPFFSDVSQLLIQIFDARPNAAMLDLAKQIIVMFGGEGPAVTNEQKMTTHSFFLAFMQRSLVFFEEGIRDHPDFAENFLTLLSQVAKKRPKLYGVEGCNLLGLFQAGLVGISMPEPVTIKASCSFLSEFIMLGEKSPVIRGLMTSQGQNLLDVLLRAIGGDAPRHVVDHTADILLSLNKVHFDHVGSWLETLLKQPEYPSPHVSADNKEQFIRKILREKVHRRRLKENVKEFTLMCRGLYGTEYGAQTAGVL